MIYCPECESQASPKAPFCPKCGHPLTAPLAPPADRIETQVVRRPTREPDPIPPIVVVRPMPAVQTIEKTGKFWKAVMGVGALMSILGGGTCAAGFSTSDHPSGITLLAMACAGVGVAVFIVGRIGAWWFHG